MRKIKSMAVTVAVAAATLVSAQASNVFAANEYGINYSGGENLGENNVQINEGLVDELTPLVKYGASEGNDVEISASQVWKSGYLKTASDACLRASYFEVSEGSEISDGLSYSISKRPYKMEIVFSKVILDDLTLGNQSAAVAVSTDDGGLYVGIRIYSDNQCSTQIEEIKPLSFSDDGKIFVQTGINVYENNKNLISDGLYFGITDIDAGQSYKILNSNNLLSSDDMYAKNKADLQPPESETTLRNKYNVSGNYIYSEYNTSTGAKIDLSKSDIFVKINETVLADGLDVVFGFAGPAGSGIEYYAKQFAVKYVSDKNGIITGIADENIISGRNPSGSTSKSKDGFEFAYWKADVDVALKDGTTVKAGGKLTSEQVKQVVVEKDITFTAIHEDVPENNNTKVPDTGDFTSNESLAPVVLSVFGIVLGALAIWSLPRIVHKKIKFD